MGMLTKAKMRRMDEEGGEVVDELNSCKKIRRLEEEPVELVVDDRISGLPDGVLGDIVSVRPMAVGDCRRRERDAIGNRDSVERPRKGSSCSSCICLNDKLVLSCSITARLIAKALSSLTARAHTSVPSTHTTARLTQHVEHVFSDARFFLRRHAFFLRRDISPGLSC
jgi:hypothetical protein